MPFYSIFNDHSDNQWRNETGIKFLVLRMLTLTGCIRKVFSGKMDFCLLYKCVNGQRVMMN